MFDQSYTFQSGTILDQGIGESAFVTPKQNPGVTSGLGGVDLSGFLRRHLGFDDGDLPAYGFLSAMLRHGL